MLIILIQVDLFLVDVNEMINIKQHSILKNSAIYSFNVELKLN